MFELIDFYIDKRLLGKVSKKVKVNGNFPISSPPKKKLPLPRVTLSEVASLLSQNPTQDNTTMRAQGR